MTDRRRRVFSGIQPSGHIHIGNYLGAITQWVASQDAYDNVFCIVDLHAITVPQDPAMLRNKTRELAGLYLACGIDPAKSAVFVQSHLPEHSELTWLLNCVTPVGWLERMTQYKSKGEKQESVGMGLLDYPVLMAADILLYDTDLVPVGDDQKQHVELTRDIAGRFNHHYGEVFVVPEVVIRPSAARVMGLDDPTAKMSKSETSQHHAIGLLDPPDLIRKAIMRAVTDTGSETRFEHASPGVSNLLQIYEVLTGEDRAAIEARFEGQGYGTLKRTVADAVLATLEPIQARYRTYAEDPAALDAILAEGAERVRPLAAGTLARARAALGFLPPAGR
jgi:tryptophanyl-tRNA synthetase